MSPFLQRPAIVLCLCWLVMLGNALCLIAPAPTVALYYPELAPVSIGGAVVGVMSICCALILRRMIVRSIRHDDGKAGGTPHDKAS
jgi:hypothetical protein